MILKFIFNLLILINSHVYASVYTINANAHYCSPRPISLLPNVNATQVMFTFKFNSTSNYIFTGTASSDQSDINKLAGTTDCGKIDPLKESARFGWRCYDSTSCSSGSNGIQIFAYVHYKGKVYSKYMGSTVGGAGAKTSIPLNTFGTGKISSVVLSNLNPPQSITVDGLSYNGNAYKFELSGVPGGPYITYMPRNCSGNLNGYRDYPYFGGNQTAPHAIQIELVGNGY